MIYIKESVYHEAASNIGRSRFTLAHELSHFILLTVKEFEIKKTDTKPVCYKDPEWQANTLASELLVPYYETQNMTVEEITTSCNVSEECAIVVYRKRQKKMSPTNRL
jgi:Zn-dependent peptidase ImmA (M78 family)